MRRPSRRSGGGPACGSGGAVDAAFFDVALPRVYGYFLLRTAGDRHAAEDLTQETFLAFAGSLAAHAPAIPDQGAWLFGIARHKLLDFYRRRARDDRLCAPWSEAVGELAEDPGDLDRVADLEEATALLAPLPERQRIVLLLRYAEGLTIRETAAALGITDHAVESLLARALRALRRSPAEKESV